MTRWIRSLPDRHGRTTLILLAAILALGFGLRAYRVAEPLQTPGDDAAAYYDLSKSLYEEGSYGSPGFRDASDWSPGAPLLYAGSFYATGGAREGTARIVELLLGVASILVIFLLARRIACGPAGLLAAFGAAVYPPFIHSTGALFSEPPAILTLPAAVLTFLYITPPPPLPGGARESDMDGPSLLRPGAALALSGLLFGLTALIRPEYLAVGVAFVLLAGFRVVKARGWRPGLAGAALMVLALLVPVVPWTVHNVVTLDRVVPISTGGGKALYVGTYLPADGEYQRVKALLVERYLHRDLEPGSEALDEVDPAPLFDRVARAHPDLPRDEALGRIGKDNLYDYVEEDPAGYAAMTARKVWRMWSAGIGEAMSSTAGRVVQVMLVLLALAGLAVLAVRRRWWEAVAMATPIAVVTVVGAASLAAPRRNEILMTLVFPLVGTAIARAGGALFSSDAWTSPRQESSPPS
jgi:4-amino-4-deoxy-L-arabinose transferase-like glycosyltransferase